MLALIRMPGSSNVQDYPTDASPDPQSVVDADA